MSDLNYKQSTAELMEVAGIPKQNSLVFDDSLSNYDSNISFNLVKSHGSNNVRYAQRTKRFYQEFNTFK